MMPTIVVSVNGTLCQVVNMFDIDGDPTIDPGEATSAVVELPNNKGFLAMEFEALEYLRPLQ